MQRKTNKQSVTKESDTQFVLYNNIYIYIFFKNMSSVLRFPGRQLFFSQIDVKLS